MFYRIQVHDFCAPVSRDYIIQRIPQNNNINNGCIRRDEKSWTTHFASPSSSPGIKATMTEQTWKHTEKQSDDFPDSLGSGSRRHIWLRARLFKKSWTFWQALCLLCTTLSFCFFSSAKSDPPSPQPGTLTWKRQHEQQQQRRRQEEEEEEGRGVKRSGWRDSCMSGILRGDL